MISPYFTDGRVTLYHGRMEDVLPELHEEIDLIIADPPYAETSLPWDEWPDGWPSKLIGRGNSMWCFGSMRMFLDRRDEFADWKMSQDIVWEKHNGSGFAADRFKRVHEIATHWYRGGWLDVHHETPRVPGGAGKKSIRARGAPPHTGAIGNAGYTDDGLRLTRSVIFAHSEHGRSINPTQKPTGLLEPLISYGCPPGGLVLDPFAGSCSALIAARNLGRRGIGIEMREEQCEAAARRLAQDCLDFGDAS